MCQFCLEHGEGERWYHQASTYAFDLESDMLRRDYMVDFVRSFDRTRARAIVGLELAASLPGPIERLIKRKVSARATRNHFGQPVSIEDCEGIFDHTTSITRIPCICRRYAGTKDDAYCMAVTTKPIDDVLLEGFSDYQDGPDLSEFQRIDRDEATEMLAECEQMGLMHSVWTFKTPFIAGICNCDLSSGCMAMRITREYETPMMWRGEGVAVLDEEACTRCGACARLCPFDAIDAGRGRVALRQHDCWGCGICRAVCEPGAISLVDRRDVPAVAGVW